MFTDPRDGKVYKTVKIGNQIWLAQNLNYEAEGSLCYDNDPANAEKYGRLYDFETAKKACPPGWHLPSIEEWETLVDFAGGEKIAGKKLRATDFNGTDEFGFSALLGGFSRANRAFRAVGKNGFWWLSGENDNGYYWGIAEIPYWVKDYKGLWFSLRCIKD